MTETFKKAHEIANAAKGGFHAYTPDNPNLLGIHIGMIEAFIEMIEREHGGNVREHIVRDMMRVLIGTLFIGVRPQYYLEGVADAYNFIQANAEDVEDLRIYLLRISRGDDYHDVDTYGRSMHEAFD